MLDAISEPLFDAISIVLALELCMLGLMVAPLPSLMRGPLVNFLASSNLLAAAMRPAGYFFALVVATWAFTTREMMRLKTAYSGLQTLDIGVKLQHESLARAPAAQHAARAPPPA